MDNLKTSKNFCAALWTHLHIINNGETYPCCMTPIENENSLGNVNKDSLLDIVNSDVAKKMRKDMLEDKPLPASCERCVSREENGITSMRHGMNDMWFDSIAEDIKNTKEDGTVEKLNLKYWDFRFSNHCNLSCRTCGPLFSTSWANDYKALKIDNQKTGLINLDEAHIFWKDLEGCITNVREVMFAGGEPILMSEHWKLLDLFEKHNHYDVELKYSTNVTLLHRGKKDLLKLWPKFRHVHLSLSLDGVGESFNYIRNGGEWSVVERNLLNLHANHIDFWIHPTISNLNIFRLPEIHKRLFDLGVIPLELKETEKYYTPDDYFIKRFHLNPLFVPEYYSIRTLPTHLKEQASENLNKYSIEMNEKHGIPTKGWDSIIKFMWEEDASDRFQDFVDMTIKLDILRNQNILSINPEYSQYFK